MHRPRRMRPYCADVIRITSLSPGHDALKYSVRQYSRTSPGEKKCKQDDKANLNVPRGNGRNSALSPSGWRIWSVCDATAARSRGEISRDRDDETQHEVAWFVQFETRWQMRLADVAFRLPKNRRNKLNAAYCVHCEMESDHNNACWRIWLTPINKHKQFVKPLIDYANQLMIFKVVT